MTKQEFLQDTINYYWGKPERMCMSLGCVCRYSPKTLGLEGKSEGCAIGRHLTPELKEKLDDKFSGKTVMHEALYLLLPDWMQKLGKEFLTKMQELHDYKELSSEDFDEIIRTCDRFSGLDYDKLTFPETN